ncbi:MAG: hypothetical protein JW936_08315 [Sedimentisphaerales bacterium]|nr:hypothetical protein [Sedimentisphaerales bacterium]
MPNEPAQSELTSSLRLSNVCWGAAASLFYGLGRFLVLVILAKSFASDTVGQFVLAWAIVTPLAYLLNMELRIVLAADPAREVRVGDCLTIRFISNAVLAAVLLLCCWYMRHHWTTQKSLVLLFVGAVRIVESWGEILLAVPQRHERMRSVAISQTLKLTALLLWLAIAISQHWSIAVILLGWFVATALVVISYDYQRARQLEPVRLRFKGIDYSRLLRAGISLGVFMTLVHANDKVGQYFAALRLGDTAVAYLGTITAVAAGVILIQAGVNQALLPRLARYFNTDRSAFWRLLLKMLLISSLVAAMAVLLVAWQGSFILRLLFRAEYAAQHNIFTLAILSTAVLLMAMILGDALVAAQHFASRMVAVAMGLAVNVTLCWWLVRPEHGLAPAVWSAIAAAATTALACVVFLLATRKT